jgi:hypothetical protein
MTVHNLMAGYTTYTDAQELAATRGTHRNIPVTSTSTVSLSSLIVAAAVDDFARQEKAVKLSILTNVRQVHIVS